MARAGSQASAEAAASTTYGTAMPLTCWRLTSIPRSPASAWGTPASGSHWTCTRMWSPGLQETEVALVDDAMAKALQRRSETLG
jgi:hypothetical protein